MSKHKTKRHITEDDVAQPHLGEKLKRARESRELSVADVAVRLKLSTYKINALERGDIEGLAAPVFVAGYIRTYARLLGLSEAEVLADFEALLPVTESAAEADLMTNDKAYGKITGEISDQFSLREKSAGNYLGLIGLVGVIAVVAVYLLWPSSSVVRSNVVDVADVTINKKHTEAVAEIDVVSIGETVETVVDDTRALLANENQDREMTHSVEVEKTVMLAPVDEVAKTYPPVAEDMKSELVLSFNSDSWAEVQDARGQRLVYRLGKTGSTRVVTGIAPFFVQLGFVQGVDILYNGAVYDLSKYANRRSVRLRIGSNGDAMSRQ